MEEYKKISNREHRRLEDMARRSDLRGLFYYFAELSAPLYLDRPLLIGSRQDEDILLEGYVRNRAALEHFIMLDPVYNRNTRKTKTFASEKRTEEAAAKLKGVIKNPLHRHFPTTLPCNCFLKNVSPCSGKIIRAHAIQESRLRPISKNGEVYYAVPLSEQKESMVDFALRGINKVTTFTGFCAKHDNEVFRPIETMQFSETPEHIFLYHFRALCKDYYIRLHAKAYLEKVIPDLSDFSGSSQLNRIQDLLEMTELDLLEMEAGIPIYENMLKNKTFHQLGGCWMRGTGIPGILFTTFVYPLRDLLNRPFPNGSSSNLQNWVQITQTIDEGVPLVIVAGMKESPLLGQLLDSISKTDINNLPAALSCYALANTENFILIPSWWEGLEARAQRAARLTFNTKFYTDYFQGPFNWTFNEPTMF